MSQNKNVKLVPKTGRMTVTSSGSVTVELGQFLQSPAGKQQLGDIRRLRDATKSRESITSDSGKRKEN